MNLNKVMLVGRITQDLELKTTTTGREVLNFSVATNRTWKDGQNSCSIFRKRTRNLC